MLPAGGGDPGGGTDTKSVEAPPVASNKAIAVMASCALPITVIVTTCCGLVVPTSRGANARAEGEAVTAATLDANMRDSAAPLGEPRPVQGSQPQLPE